METKLYLQMLRKGWWIILLTVLVAVNATLIYSLTVTPRYQATTKLLVSPDDTVMSDSQRAINSLDTLDNRSVVATYAEFLNSDKVFLEAIDSLGLDKTTLVDYTRTAIILPDARVLEVTVEGPEPKVVAALANAISEKGVNYIRKFYQVYTINPIDLAATPAIPISPNPLRDALLALVFGLILGAALAILSEQIRIPFDAMRQTRFLDNDSLAYNRRHFDRLLELEMMRCRANSDVFSLGLVRLDGLADYIDNVPQILLQKILQGVTKTLKKDIKGNDVIGRWNDTTFAIILPSTPYNAANNLIGKLRQKLSDPVKINGGDETIRLEPYVGVARSKEDEVIEDFITRVQKDLDEDMYNVPVPPPPAVKPGAEAARGTSTPVAPHPAAPAPQSAASRLSALFASAPPVPPSTTPPPAKPAESYTSAAAAASEKVAPFTTSQTISPLTTDGTNQTAAPETSFQVTNGTSVPKSPVQQNDIEKSPGLYNGDILDVDGPPSELSQDIDDDLNEMRKHWKIN
ncbi:MAG: diguanylate cyclase [Anaerolineaceae bacterium]